MSNTPTLPDHDVAEPIPAPEYDDDVVGIPLDDGIGPDVTEPVEKPEPLEPA